MKALSIFSPVRRDGSETELPMRLIEVSRELRSSIKELYSAAAPLQSLKAVATSKANLPTAMKSPMDIPSGTTMFQTDHV